MRAGCVLFAEDGRGFVYLLAHSDTKKANTTTLPI